MLFFVFNKFEVFGWKINHGLFGQNKYSWYFLTKFNTILKIVLMRVNHMVLSSLMCTINLKTMIFFVYFYVAATFEQAKFHFMHLLTAGVEKKYMI